MSVPTSTTLMRRPAVEATTGIKRSALYQHVSKGTFPKPIRIGARAVAWPHHEVEAVVRARISGADDDAIRKLVAELHEARSQAAHGGAAAA